jgi:hypothetical protein
MAERAEETKPSQAEFERVALTLNPDFKTKVKAKEYFLLVSEARDVQVTDVD